jgi:hypothetical protein
MAVHASEASGYATVHRIMDIIGSNAVGGTKALHYGTELDTVS